jgi:conjugal transfer pilus assembly protein TraB
MSNSKLTEFWADTQKRNIVLGVVGFVLLGIIFKFVFLEESKPMKRKKKVESYQKATLFNSDDIKKIDSKELEKLYSTASTDLQKREKEMIREKKIINEDLLEMQQRMDEQELNTKKQRQQMALLIKGRLNNKEIADVLGEIPDKKRAAYVNKRGGGKEVDVSLPPTEISGPPLIKTNEPTPSAIQGNVIRTISQNNIRQIHTSGEIVNKGYVKNYINASGHAIPTEEQKNEEQTNITKQESKKKYVYLPAGSFFSAVMLTGLNAPTAMASDRSPMPVVFRIKKEAILPNNYRADIRECHAIGEAVGDLATERANIRLVTLSCISVTGEAVETGIQAVAVNDYDGIIGVAGELITKNGNLLAGSMAASFMSSLSTAVSPRQVPQLSTNGDSGTFTALSNDDLMNMGSSALLGGASGAMEKLAEYYIELADAMHPVISIPPGRGVTFMVLKGTKLSLEGGL